METKRPFPSKIFDCLSKRELQDFLEVLHYSMDAETDDDARQVLHMARKLVPGQSLIAGLIRFDQSIGSHQFSKLVNISYHPDWVSRYLKDGYADVDPVLLAHLETFRTQVWSNSYKTATCKREKEFIEEAKSFGLASGITSGSYDARRSIGSFFSFAGGSVEENRHYAGILECLSYYLHHVLVKSAPSYAYNYVNGLSAREMTVLNWMKRGKTNWEISRILGISERTIRFHVESIFNKLDVTSRTQAVAIAMEHGLLTVASAAAAS
jgi:DNA-binding CsgD family transcriptional regulator